MGFVVLKVAHVLAFDLSARSWLKVVLPISDSAESAGLCSPLVVDDHPQAFSSVFFKTRDNRGVVQIGRR